MRNVLKIPLVIAATTPFLTEGAVAASIPPGPEARCDANTDGIISGSEIPALAKIRISPILMAYDADCDGKISAGELAYINGLVDSAIKDDGGITEAAMTVEARDTPINVSDAKPPKKTDKPPQRLFISKDKVTPRPDLLSKSGAILSFTDDHAAGTHSLTVDAVVTYLLTNPDTPRSNTGPLGDFNIAAYLDLKGRVNSGTSDVTSAIFGVDYLFDLEGNGLFDLQTVSIGPYFQTDFDGDAEIYGVTMSWTPIRSDWQLGTARKQTGNWLEHVIWQARTDLDYRSVKKIGETQLAQGDQFWVGISLGAKIYPFGELGSATPFIDLGFETRRDLTNGDDATLSSVSFNFPLSEDGKSAVILSYENGENYQTGEEMDRTIIGFSYKF